MIVRSKRECKKVIGSYTIELLKLSLIRKRVKNGNACSDYYVYSRIIDRLGRADEIEVAICSSLQLVQPFVGSNEPGCVREHGSIQPRVLFGSIARPSNLKK